MSIMEESNEIQMELSLYSIQNYHFGVFNNFIFQSFYIFIHFIPLMEETYNNKKEMIKNIVKQSLATVEGVYQEYKGWRRYSGASQIQSNIFIGKNKIWK